MRTRLKHAAVAALAGSAIVACAVFFWRPAGAADIEEARARLKRAPVDYQDLKAAVGEFRLATPTFDGEQQALARLGRQLFFDTRLSANGKVSCASCHRPELSFTDGLALARGIGQIERNTPTIINTFASYWFFWDGRADSLAAQALGPLEAAAEHGITRAEIARVIGSHYRADYERLFGPLDSDLLTHLPQAARPAAPELKISEKVSAIGLTSLGDPAVIRRLAARAGKDGVAVSEVFAREALPREAADSESTESYAALDAARRAALDQIAANVGMALEAFERGLVANDSAFDRFATRWSESAENDPTPLFAPDFGPREMLGLVIFTGRGQCTLCHIGPTFTDQQFHNIALPRRDEAIALGRSIGIQKVLTDPFNCRGSYLGGPLRHESESCRDLAFLDPDTPEAVGAFKTPTLRNVAETAPYTHDGRFASLGAVLDHYNKMDSLPAVGFKEESLKPIGLDPVELGALEAFLRSLSSPVRDLTAEEVAH